MQSYKIAHEASRILSRPTGPYIP